MTLLCKHIVVPKSKEVKPGCDLAECCRHCRSSKSDVLSMMVMIGLDYSRRQSGIPDIVGNIKSFTTENCRAITLAALIVVCALED
jgi:hypothetical protein